MQYALVQGRATSTVKHESLESQRLLICSILGSNHQPAGDPVLVLDWLGAGTGDRVILTSDSKGLSEHLKASNSPARWWTLGIVD